MWCNTKTWENEHSSRVSRPNFIQLIPKMTRKIFLSFFTRRFSLSFQLESFKNFDFELWRQRYITWVRNKKFRITDFFRRQDKQGYGTLMRQEFVEGMLASSTFKLYLSLISITWELLKLFRNCSCVQGKKIRMLDRFDVSAEPDCCPD